MNLPARFVRRARISLTKDRVPELVSPESQDSRDSASIPAAVNFVIRDPLLYHYFHFLEIFIFLYALKMEYFPTVEKIVLHVGGQVWNNPKQNNVQEKILACVFPEAIVVETPSEKELEHLVVIDRRLSHTTINKFMDPAITLCMKWAPHLRARIHQALALTAAGPRPKPKALYVKRVPPRHLLPAVEEELLTILADRYTVEKIDFATMSWEDQVRAAHASDLIVGCHGNGLTNLLWARPECAVLELFPAGIHHYDYQVMAEVMGLKYFGIEGANIYTLFTRAGPVKGNEKTTHVPVASLNRASVDLALASFLRGSTVANP